MKSILTTYPDFQRLPKGLKQLLLESETYFFHEAESLPRSQRRSRPGFGKDVYPNFQPEAVHADHSVGGPWNTRASKKFEHGRFCLFLQ